MGLQAASRHQFPLSAACILRLAATFTIDRTTWYNTMKQILLTIDRTTWYNTIIQILHCWARFTERQFCTAVAR